jgi:hypothetical protein
VKSVASSCGLSLFQGVPQIPVPLFTSREGLFAVGRPSLEGRSIGIRVLPPLSRRFLRSHSHA